MSPFKNFHAGYINCDGNAVVFIDESNSDYKIAKKLQKIKDDSVNIIFKNNTAIVEFLDKDNIRMSERIFKCIEEYDKNNEMSDNAKTITVFLIFVAVGIFAYFYLPNH